MNRFNLDLAAAARFTPRAPQAPVAARDIPAHEAKAWTGGDRPESAAERVRRMLDL